MKYYNFHCRVQNLNLLKDIILRNSTSFYPLFTKCKDNLSKQLSYFISEDFESTFFSQHHEIIVDKEKNVMIDLSTPRTDFYSRNVVNIRIFAKKEDDRMVKLISNLQRNKKIKMFSPGAFIESNTINRLATELRNLSPNGKLIKDKGLSEYWKYGENIETRKAIKKYISTIGKMPIHAKEAIGIVKKIDARLPRIFQDKKLLFEQFAINCKECTTMPILYETIEKARQGLKDSKCGECGKDTLQLTKAIQLRPEVYSVLSTGVWLENLVTNIVNKFTNYIWSGSMYGNDEVDIAAFFCGRIFIIECKDTSFGQNDYYILLRKAENIRANIIGVITTQEIHKNVKQAIERDFRRNDKKIFIIEEEGADKITNAISRYFNKLLNDYVRDILTRPREEHLIRRALPYSIHRNIEFHSTL
jgi:hypothetical protein